MADERVGHVSRTALVALLVLHAVAFGLLFLMLSTIGHAFVDHYKAIGFASTPRFDLINQMADFASRYAIASVVVVAIDALIVRWILKHRVRWLSAYSHAYLAAVVFAMFITVTWMINPIAARAKNGGGGAAPANPVVASTN